MEGARWDILQGVIMESKLKELFPEMPVINVRVGKQLLFLIQPLVGSIFRLIIVDGEC
jgi:hypothetical protein